MKKTKIKTKKAKNDISVIVNIGGVDYENSGKTIVEALEKFKMDDVKLGGKALLSVKKGGKAYQFAYRSFFLRKLCASKIQRELFEKRALTVLGS